MKLSERTSVNCCEPRDRRASLCGATQNGVNSRTYATTAWPKRALVLDIAAHMPAVVRGNQTPTITFDGVRRSPEHPR